MQIDDDKQIGFNIVPNWGNFSTQNVPRLLIDTRRSVVKEHTRLLYNDEMFELNMVKEHSAELNTTTTTRKVKIQTIFVLDKNALVSAKTYWRCLENYGVVSLIISRLFGIPLGWWRTCLVQWLVTLNRMKPCARNTTLYNNSVFPSLVCWFVNVVWSALTKPDYSKTVCVGNCERDNK